MTAQVVLQPALYLRPELLLTQHLDKTKPTPQNDLFSNPKDINIMPNA